MCDEIGIYFLDGDVIEINGVKFGGTCSWYNLPTSQDISTWKKVMNDSVKIYNGYSKQPYGMYQSYEQPSNNWNTQDFWMKQKAKLIEISQEKCDVFITHVPLNEPTKEEGMADEFIGDPDNIFYYTNNFELLKQSGCSVAIHGHTHQSLDYVKDGIRILCQPLGYPSNNTYNFVKQIEIYKYL
jgi:hypothetical protein